MYTEQELINDPVVVYIAAMADREIPVNELDDLSTHLEESVDNLREAGIETELYEYEKQDEQDKTQYFLTVTGGVQAFANYPGVLKAAEELLRDMYTAEEPKAAEPVTHTFPARRLNFKKTVTGAKVSCYVDDKEAFVGVAQAIFGIEERTDNVYIKIIRIPEGKVDVEMKSPGFMSEAEPEKESEPEEQSIETMAEEEAPVEADNWIEDPEESEEEKPEKSKEQIKEEIESDPNLTERGRQASANLLDGYGGGDAGNRKNQI